ncbi:hypothetical protein ELQ35_06140 [Peribacillus cavernae]|uniref:PucR C-terminal helix-turn-helix domain-containing protein n=1 Tax=Peribacillus cavernae TaxID=1674310 RepID=A0A433HNN0_9BACI|nr:helix-turn-helix domain-containing protein [Peribacillus cavernae]MDQ0217635.1 hypothetical protein [Peribacillus cavernae]RUQ29936.1 hypothetical protein ELQ35_06140 [Peribacillus cavernae]
MIEKLKLKFPGAIKDFSSCSEPERYEWFQDETGDQLGIPKSDMSKEEVGLLRLLFPFKTMDVTERNANLPKKQWSDFLYKNSSILPLTSWDAVRYTQFTVSNNDHSYLDFEEAFLAFMDGGALIIWENDLSGVLIEGENSENYDINGFSAVLNTLESDFYLKIRTFMGGFHSVNNKILDHFLMEQKGFKLSKEHLSNMKAANLPMVFPHAVMAGLEKSDSGWYIEQLLRDTKDDDELISSVKMYIECSSNASLAAKRLFIHRNSLQYRIDKFIEKTGLDIRSFQHCFTTYLAILMNN